MEAEREEGDLLSGLALLPVLGDLGDVGSHMRVLTPPLNGPSLLFNASRLACSFFCLKFSSLLCGGEPATSSLGDWFFKMAGIACVSVSCQGQG